MAGAAPLPPFQLYSYVELTAATGGWGDERRLGSGGFGEVYEGELPGGVRVAVKRLHCLPSLPAAAAEPAFRAEVNAMLAVCAGHPNLLPILGACMDSPSPLCLVSPLMAGGSFFARLHEGAQAQATRPSPGGAATSAAAAAPMPAAERLDACIHAARALVYLHGRPQPVVHGDVKSMNVLLDPARGRHSCPHMEALLPPECAHLNPPLN